MEDHNTYCMPRNVLFHLPDVMTPFNVERYVKISLNYFFYDKIFHNGINIKLMKGIYSHVKITKTA